MFNKKLFDKINPQIGLIYFVLIYLVMILIFSDRSIYALYKLYKTKQQNLSDIQRIDAENKSLSHKLSLLNSNTFNLQYLEELARREFGFAHKDEYLIIIDADEKGA